MKVPDPNSSEAIARCLLLLVAADREVTHRERDRLLESQNRVERAVDMELSGSVHFQRFADHLARDCERLGATLGVDFPPSPIVTSAIRGIEDPIRGAVYRELLGLVHADGLHLDEQLMLERFEEAWDLGRR